MYAIKVQGLGFIRKNWKDDEPRFCADFTHAKTWKTLPKALEFGDKKLTPRLRIGWELWQDVEGELIPLIQPQRSQQ